MTDDDSELEMAFRVWRAAKPEFADFAMPSADDPLANMLREWWREARPYVEQFGPQRDGETRMEWALRSGGDK